MKKSVYKPKPQRGNKNATSTFLFWKAFWVAGENIWQYSESLFLISKAGPSIKACDSEKHLLFSGHYTPLSCAVAVLLRPLWFSIRRPDSTAGSMLFPHLKKKTLREGGHYSERDKRVLFCFNVWVNRTSINMQPSFVCWAVISKTNY